MLESAETAEPAALEVPAVECDSAVVTDRSTLPADEAAFVADQTGQEDAPALDVPGDAASDESADPTDVSSTTAVTSESAEGEQEGESDAPNTPAPIEAPATDEPAAQEEPAAVEPSVEPTADPATGSEETAGTTGKAAAAVPEETLRTQAGLTPSVQELPLDSYDASKLLANNKVYTFARTESSALVVANQDGLKLTKAKDSLDGYWRVKNLGQGRYQLVSMKDGSLLSYAQDGSAATTGSTGVWLLLKRLNGTYSLVPEDFQDLRLQRLGTKDGSGFGLNEASKSGAQGFVFTLAKWLTTAVKKGATVAEGIYALNAGVGKKQVVQVSKASTDDGANVLTYKATANMNQRWHLEMAGNNLYTLRAVHSDKVLAVEDGATESGSNVCQSSFDGSLAQYWYLLKTGSQFYIRNAKSGCGLSVKDNVAKNGTNVQIFTPSTLAAQHYSLVRDVALEEAIDAGKPLSEGIYTVKAGVNKKLVLDVNGSSTANGANVRLATSASTLNQKVELTYLGFGLYSIQFANSGKYLHVKGGSSKAGATVIQWKRMANSRSQKWYFVKTSSGYQLRSGISGLALEVKGGSTKSGTDAIVSQANVKKTSESFKLSQVSLLPNGTYVFASALDPGQLVEVKGSWKKAGVNVQVGRMRKAAGQYWTITYLGKSTYKIINKNSKMALEVKGASMDKGGNVDQGIYKGTAAQKWVLGISDAGTMTLKNLGSALYLDLAGGKSAGGTNVQQWTRAEAKRQGFLPYTESSSFVKTGKTGYQNPSQYYQISAYNCVLPSYAKGFYTYVSPSAISPLATRAQCVEAFIAHAMKYLGTPYVWDWSMRPGQGVDCSGLVMQCLYAVGMQTPYNTYDHMYDPWQDHNAENMHADTKFKQIPFSQRKRGDLIFYNGHVGIYLGNNQIINAYPPNVQIQSVYSWTVTGCSRVFV